MDDDFKENLLERYEPRIRALRPDLEIHSLALNTEGIINDVVLVNEALVFRFAKNERSVQALAAELQILDRVRPKLSLSMPAPFHTEADLVAYPLLPGAPLTRLTLLQQPEAIQEALAHQLGTFLRELHSVETSGLPPTRAPVTRERWLNLYQRIQEKIYPLFLPFQREWAQSFFAAALANAEFFHYPPALIHGDLAPYHLLFSAEQKRLTGVIDFGVSGVGDPASDVGILVSIYGETFVRRLQAAYPALAGLLPRARFYAQAIEFEWVLNGLENPEETFWFTAHLGGARDLRI